MTDTVYNVYFTNEDRQRLIRIEARLDELLDGLKQTNYFEQLDKMGVPYSKCEDLPLVTERSSNRFKRSDDAYLGE